MQWIIRNIAINTTILQCLAITMAGGVDLSVSYASFRSGETHYVEVYTRFIGTSLIHTASPMNLKALGASVEILYILESDGKIALAEKYVVNSPLTERARDFWDMKRFSLRPGHYDLRIQCIDLNNLNDTLDLVTKLVLRTGETIPHSDILLMSAVDQPDSNLPFSKRNFRYEPLAFNTLTASQDTFYSYFEIYDSDQLIGDDFFIRYKIIHENRDSMDDNRDVTGYRKLRPAVVVPVLLSVNLIDNSTGDYLCKIEVCRKNKEVIHTIEKAFSIYHPLADIKARVLEDREFETAFVQHMDIDQLNYALKAIFPKIKNNLTETLNIIIENEDLMSKRYFLYQYWTGFSLTQPFEVYQKYMEVARAVDQTYQNNVGFGFETDRGYIFLKYGRPDDVVFVEDEPSAPPYEIWIYNYMEATRQTDVKFLFYNPSLASNDFILLHSTCRGEVNNPRWELVLYEDALSEMGNNQIDNVNMQDNWNRNARRYFTDY